MQRVEGLLGQAQAYIQRDDFFADHGLYLGLLWMFGIIFGILIRKVSRFLHALAFLLIDVISVFYIVGAILRVYPKIVYFNDWSLLKQGHVVGGAIFLVILVIQHVGGVTTLLKGQRFNVNHRKFALIVTNSGRFSVVFGLILAEKEKYLIYGSAAISAAFIVLTIKYLKELSALPSKAKKLPSEVSRSRSPPRQVKRD